MKNWKKTATLSALLLAASAATAIASGFDQPVSSPTPISAPADAAPILDPDVAGAYLRLVGPVEWVDLEGGFWAVGGTRLIGDPEEFKKYAGQEVVVEGTEFTGISFQMVPAINVISIRPAGEVEAMGPVQWDVTADAPLPREIRVNGASVSAELGAPVVVDGVLFVPLRAIVEAAGGELTWDGELHQVNVRLPDRTASFHIGQQEAEMYVDGVMYVTVNRIAMAQPVQIVNDRTMISADAISTVLGLQQVEAEEGVLSLVPASRLVLPAPELVGQEGRWVGRISRVEGSRILLEGPIMENGQPDMIWLTVTEETEITVDGGAGSMADLQVGAEVVAVIDGPVAESFPAQAKAGSILVLPAPRADIMTVTVKEIADGRILVEGEPMASGEPFMAWLAVDENTRITVGSAEGTLADLTAGTRIEVELTGPMLMSYPAQGGAASIRVLTAEEAQPPRD
ncbi:hypothetical protein J2Z79_002271 [Symbiobacterium terraclitae]|uniref:Copper amine oxidase-like N-terminal domain-containing protein n=1 Tax=Symbiobacterium terraclitae TaxID=557451 RepID=A0ABS4JVC3_9FIRM|nr:hypothetical protein [Symbiobacterium terraclitae]